MFLRQFQNSCSDLGVYLHIFDCSFLKPLNFLETSLLKFKKGVSNVKASNRREGLKISQYRHIEKRMI